MDAYYVREAVNQRPRVGMFFKKLHPLCRTNYVPVYIVTMRQHLLLALKI